MSEDVGESKALMFFRTMYMKIKEMFQGGRRHTVDGRPAIQVAPVVVEAQNEIVVVTVYAFY